MCSKVYNGCESGSKGGALRQDSMGSGLKKIEF
jgi:hypothetical protein